jgi:hypothetical protein
MHDVDNVHVDSVVASQGKITHNICISIVFNLFIAKKSITKFSLDRPNAVADKTFTQNWSN